MPRRSTSQSVPKDLQARFDAITQLTDGFAQTYLNDEYAQLCRQLTATLCRKRPSPLVPGKAATWACGMVHASAQEPCRWGEQGDDSSAYPSACTVAVQGDYWHGLGSFHARGDPVDWLA